MAAKSGKKSGKKGEAKAAKAAKVETPTPETETALFVGDAKVDEETVDAILAEETPKKEKPKKGKEIKGDALKAEAVQRGIVLGADDTDKAIRNRIECQEQGITTLISDNEEKLTERLKLFKEDQAKRAAKVKEAKTADADKEKEKEKIVGKYGIVKLQASIEKLIAHKDFVNKPSIQGQLRQAAQRLKTVAELLPNA